MKPHRSNAIEIEQHSREGERKGIREADIRCRSRHFRCCSCRRRHRCCARCLAVFLTLTKRPQEFKLPPNRKWFFAISNCLNCSAAAGATQTSTLRQNPRGREDGTREGEGGRGRARARAYNAHSLWSASAPPRRSMIEEVKRKGQPAQPAAAVRKMKSNAS